MQLAREAATGNENSNRNEPLQFGRIHCAQLAGCQSSLSGHNGQLSVWLTETNARATSGHLPLLPSPSSSSSSWCNGSCASPATSNHVYLHGHLSVQLTNGGLASQSARASLLLYLLVTQSHCLRLFTFNERRSFQITVKFTCGGRSSLLPDVAVCKFQIASAITIAFGWPWDTRNTTRQVSGGVLICA